MLTKHGGNCFTIHTYTKSSRVRLKLSQCYLSIISQWSLGREEGGLGVAAGLGRGVQWEDSFLSIHPQNRHSIDRAPESGYLINSLGDPQIAMIWGPWNLKSGLARSSHGRGTWPRRGLELSTHLNAAASPRFSVCALQVLTWKKLPTSPDHLARKALGAPAGKREKTTRSPSQPVPFLSSGVSPSSPPTVARLRNTWSLPLHSQVPVCLNQPSFSLDSFVHYIPPCLRPRGS